MTPNILIISTTADVATDDVVRRLSTRNVKITRLNTEDYPFTKQITYWPSEPEQGARLTVNDEPVTVPASIWYRRFRMSPTPQGMDEGIAAFCAQETRAAILGTIMGVRARWMSHPQAVWMAENKPYQLTVAAQLGLAIPRTIITNNPGAIKKAFHEFGRMIIKPTKTGHVLQGGISHAIYTTEVLQEHLTEVASAQWSPAIYQELITKKYDLRVTIIGEYCVAAAIDSQSDPAATIDWRQTKNPKLPHKRINLPAALTTKLHALMHALHLTFGAIDLIQTPSDEYVFLEINPSGQWLWLDDMLNLGISETVAEWLTQTV